MPGIAIRVLARGDEDIVAPALLAGLARERGIRTGFVLTEPENGPANALYRNAGADDTTTVQWAFSYEDD